MGSSPTSGALLACSSKDLNSRKKDKYNDNLQNSSHSNNISIDKKKETIRELIDSICKYQKNYVKNSLSNLLEKSPKNTEIICKHIITEQNEINIKELTKEGKIKTLIDVTKFLDFKDFDGFTNYFVSLMVTKNSNQIILHHLFLNF